MPISANEGIKTVERSKVCEDGVCFTKLCNFIKIVIYSIIFVPKILWFKLINNSIKIYRTMLLRQ